MELPAPWTSTQNVTSLCAFHNLPTQPDDWAKVAVIIAEREEQCQP